MSVKIMSAIFDSTVLGSTERLILLALADHADDEGRCYPSIARLCQRTGLGERAVQTNIRRLQAEGYITIIANGGKAGSNLYFVRATPAANAPPQEMPPASAAPTPRTKCTTPPHMLRSTPAPDAPKPSGTIIEPSIATADACAQERETSEALARGDDDLGPTDRERLLGAMGVGPDGVIGPSKFIGTQGDMAEAERWLALPGLTVDVICTEIRAVMARRPGNVPSRFSYFTGAMRDLSARLSAPPLTPSEAAGRHNSTPIAAPYPRVRGRTKSEVENAKH